MQIKQPTASKRDLEESQCKVKGIVSVAEFGAKGDGSDATDAIREALAVAAAKKYKLKIPSGRYRVHSTLMINMPFVMIEGEGIECTEIFVSGNGFRIFDTASTPNNEYDFLSIGNLKLVGNWNNDQTLGGDFDRLVRIVHTRYVHLYNIHAEYSRQMGISAGKCGEVLIENCKITNNARDGINVTGTKRGKIVHNTFIHGGDDAIAIHQQPLDGARFPDGFIVSGNHIEDFMGIKILGANKVVVSDNVLKRPKSYGIYIGYDATSVEGKIDAVGVNISDNIITDVINANKFSSSAQDVGIYVSSYYNPDMFKDDQALISEKKTPNDYWEGSRERTNPNTGGWYVNIKGNIVAKTLPNTALYSDWGVGKLFTNSGWLDPDMSSNFNLEGIGIGIGNVRNCRVSNNTVVSCSTGLQFLYSNIAKDVVIEGNTFRRIKSFGVGITPGSHKGNYSMFIINNDFDLDPYFESAVRTNPIDGTWQNSSFAPGAFQITGSSGIVISSNKFRNMSKVVHEANVTHYTIVGNYYFFDPVNLKGIRTPTGVLNEGYIIYEDSDPQSDSYGEVLFQQQGFVSSSMPTSGFYLAGQYVRSSAYSIVNDKVLLGWARLTTGTNHVHGVDWAPLYASIS